VADIEVREATPEDMEWVRGRVLESSAFSIPHLRDVPAEMVREAAEDDFERLLNSEDRLVILIAESASGERMGVLILNLDHRSDATGEPQSLIEDLDVEPRFWGTPAVGYLVRRAAQVTARHGLRYMVGLVSEGNRRTLVKAKRLGFTVERFHLAMGCTPEGPAPMPGREAEKKAHDISRRKRLKKFGRSLD